MQLLRIAALPVIACVVALATPALAHQESVTVVCQADENLPKQIDESRERLEQKMATQLNTAVAVLSQKLDERTRENETALCATTADVESVLRQQTMTEAVSPRTVQLERVVQSWFDMSLARAFTLLSAILTIICGVTFFTIMWMMSRLRKKKGTEQ